MSYNLPETNTGLSLPLTNIFCVKIDHQQGRALSHEAGIWESVAIWKDQFYGRHEQLEPLQIR